MHCFPKYEIFLSNGSKVIALGALEPPKADFSITLRPLKLQISEKVLRPMKFRSKALVLTYPKPFGMKVGGSQVFWTGSTLAKQLANKPEFSPACVCAICEN